MTLVFVSPAAWTFVPYVQLPKSFYTYKTSYSCKSQCIWNGINLLSTMVFLFQITYFISLRQFSCLVFFLCSIFNLSSSWFIFSFKFCHVIIIAPLYFTAITLVKVFITLFLKLRTFVLDFFIEMQFIYHKIHHIKMWNLTFILTKLCSILILILNVLVWEHFYQPPPSKETPYWLLVTPVLLLLFPSLSPSLSHFLSL